MQHDWIPSTLGHGETMCRNCKITNREAAVLGQLNECDAPPPQAANQSPSPDHYDEYDDYDEEDELDREHECGLMDDGQCLLAGSEWCDFGCPNRDSEYFTGSRAWIAKHENETT